MCKYTVANNQIPVAGGYVPSKAFVEAVIKDTERLWNERSPKKRQIKSIANMAKHREVTIHFVTSDEVQMRCYSTKNPIGCAVLPTYGIGFTSLYVMQSKSCVLTATVLAHELWHWVAFMQWGNKTVAPAHNRPPYVWRQQQNEAGESVIVDDSMETDIMNLYKEKCEEHPEWQMPLQQEV